VFVEEYIVDISFGDFDVLGYWDWFEGFICGVVVYYVGLLFSFKEVVE